MSAPTLLSIADVEHDYGGTFALRIDSLDVASGQTLCLLGPTGAGKSTLLRLAAGLERPKSGQICFNGCAIDRATTPPIQPRMTMVFQRPQLLNRSVRANVAYGLRLRRASGEQLAYVDWVMQQLGIWSIAAQAAGTISGGQLQLVALARALVLKPQALLLDEPTANLDPARVALVENVVRQTCQQQNTTVIWTTHNLFQARRIADRIALLLEGRIVEVADAKAFFETPAEPRTAAFLDGTMVY